MFTIDASVYLNSFNQHEPGSIDSQAFLAQVHQQALPVFAPTLLLVELAAAVARTLQTPADGLQLAQALQGLPGITWVSLDQALALQVSRVGSQHRLRGADAVYATVAQRHNTILVTLDQQHLQRLASLVIVKKPSDIQL